MVDDIKSEVKSLYEIMKEEKIQELEVSSKNCSIRVKRKGKNENKQPAILEKQETIENVVSVDNPKESSVLVETIKASITGVFYKSSSPSVPPYVAEGSIIESGKTVCIIGAMKAINEIKSPFKAKILKILVEDGKFVEAGQDLFKVERV